MKHGALWPVILWHNDIYFNIKMRNEMWDSLPPMLLHKDPSLVWRWSGSFLYWLLNEFSLVFDVCLSWILWSTAVTVKENITWNLINLHSLKWRHMTPLRLNHRQHRCLGNRIFRLTTKNTSKPRIIAAGHLWGESDSNPTGSVMPRSFPRHDVITYKYRLKRKGKK